MRPIIVLDSGPLGLLFQRTKIAAADRCRTWFRRHRDAGARVVVPEIVHYELRRELLRLRHAVAVRLLHEFVTEEPGRLIPVNTPALDLAAELWAEARQKGKSTADRHALDVGVILAAQCLTEGFDRSQFVVATSNVSHLAQFVPAEEWERI